MARLGLRFGVEAVYLPDMLKPAQIELRALLWNLYLNDSGTFHAPPPAGRVTIDSVENVPDEFWLAVGYRRLGGRVMRVDMVERVALLVRTAAREGQFKITEDMLSLAGATREQMGAMLLDMQCRIVGEEPSEDPEKPALQIFERVRRARPKAGKLRSDRLANQKAKKGDGRSKSDGKRRAAGKGHSLAKPAQNSDPNFPLPFSGWLKE